MRVLWVAISGLTLVLILCNVAGCSDGETKPLVSAKATQGKGCVVYDNADGGKDACASEEGVDGEDEGDSEAGGLLLPIPMKPGIFDAGTDAKIWP